MAKQIDRWAIQWACRILDKQVTGTDAGTDATKEALRLCTRANLFSSPTIQPAELQFADRHRFHFTSDVVTPWAENNVVSGRLYRVRSDWRNRPAVVLLHGWNGERQYQWQFPYLAWRLNRAGINAAIVELSYHGSRKPTDPGAVRNFISGDLLRVIEAARQSLCDVRSLLAWLKAEGVSRVGLWGISLGAWLSGQVAGMDTNVDFAVLFTPIVRMDRALMELPFCAPICCALANSTAHLDGLNLGSHPPRCGADGVLIIKAEHDLFAPNDTVEALWRAWGEPEIWRMRHGHISVLCSLPLMERVVRWIQRRTSTLVCLRIRS